MQANAASFKDAVSSFRTQKPGGAGAWGVLVCYRVKCRSEGASSYQKLGTGWFKVLPAVPLSPVMPFCTRVSAGMKLPLRDSSGNVCEHQNRFMLHILPCGVLVFISR